MKQLIIAWGTLVLLPANAFALNPHLKVIYFGGATAKKSELDRCFPDFHNVGYPGGGEVKAIVEEINRNPDQQYMVVGHSSGAKYANQVASARNLSNPGRITLVDLDGFAPVSVPKHIRRVCWNAQGGASGKLRSRNYSAMTEANNCGEVHTYQDQHCQSEWCMHFSMVNVDAPPVMRGGYWTGGRKRVGRYVPGDWPKLGYQGCSQAKLPWLP